MATVCSRSGQLKTFAYLGRARQDGMAQAPTSRCWSVREAFPARGRAKACGGLPASAMESRRAGGGTSQGGSLSHVWCLMVRRLETGVQGGPVGPVDVCFSPYRFNGWFRPRWWQNAWESQLVVTVVAQALGPWPHVELFHGAVARVHTPMWPQFVSRRPARPQRPVASSGFGASRARSLKHLSTPLCAPPDTQKRRRGTTSSRR